MADHAAEVFVGPEWSYILRSQANYSGLSIADLAGLLDPVLFKWHKTVYHHQSRYAHANRATTHGQVDALGRPGLKFFTDDGNLRMEMYTLLGMFAYGMGLMHFHIGLGNAAKQVLETFNVELKELFSTL